MWILFPHLLMSDRILSRSNFHLTTFLPFFHLIFVFMHVPTSACVHTNYLEPKHLIHYSICPNEISPLNAHFSTPNSLSITHLNKNDKNVRITAHISI